MSDQDTTQISRYLLGQLPKEEMDRIEARLLHDSELFELAETVEDDVVDRYVRGELAREERRRFERRFLPSARIRERVELARALAAHARRRSALRTRPAREGDVIPFFRPAAARLAWAASLVVLVLAGWLALQVVGLRSEVSEIETARLAVAERAEELAAHAETLEAAVERARVRGEEMEELQAELAGARERIAELRSRELPAAPAADEGRAERRVRRPGDYASAFLALATRSQAEPQPVELDNARGVELQLDLGGQKPAEPVTATVTRLGIVVWRETGVETEAFDGESMAVLLLPAEILQGDRYRVELTEGDPGRLLGSYDLVVKRRPG